MKRILGSVVLAALLAPLAAHPQQAQPRDRIAQAAPAPALAEGEVRKVDREANKITIRHGPLKNLDMPPMTMVFQVKDPALLDQVRPGDKIRFEADKVGGAYVVTRLEPAR